MHADLSMASTVRTNEDQLLRLLNDDILHIIFETLRPQEGLRGLSTTCKWVRCACMSVLFRKCGMKSCRLDCELENPRPVFLPQSLWPFVRVLNLCGHFSRNDLPWHRTDVPPRFDPEWGPYCALRLTSAQNLGRFVKEALISMPYLRDVNLFMPTTYPGNLWEPRDIPGVSWYLLAAILSAPRLRHIAIIGTLLHPADDLLDDYALPKLAPLTSFRYMDPEESQTAELRYGLTLRSDTAPLHAMRLWEWPRLRVLELRGERPLPRPQASAFPLVEVLWRMPHLRSLSLYFAEPEGSLPPPPIWPADRRDVEDRHDHPVYVWRDLEELTVTHPNPDDEFYAHLPAVMKRLTLRCWPRYYKHNTLLDKFKRMVGVNWVSPPLHEAGMLSILRKSSMPYLTCLEVEYCADGGDDVFRHIGSSFPYLEILRVHRYRAAREHKSPVTDIAQALAPLSRLRLLMLHLDFPDLPDVGDVAYGRRLAGVIPPERCRQIEMSFSTIVSTADIFAKILSPALEHICFLVPLALQSRQWRTFRVTHEGHVGITEFLNPVRTGMEILGFSTEHDD
ncbi:hypothetical protein C8Q78DRAFT_1147388 [Trametes maxima]|nr:hypothetical protein C8Q78DRAFT_1147388 [Trametes maxima]